MTTREIREELNFKMKSVSLQIMI